MSRKIAVIDLETDPFQYKRECKPFVFGFYDGKRYVTLWGENCIKESVEFLMQETEPLVIYAHNGGKFDWIFYLPYLMGKMQIINGRIIKAYLGCHEIRDSFAIMPFPLRDYKKDEIDYKHLEQDCRDKYRSEILEYLKGDCEYLYELVTAFRGEFGDALTIGSSSMKELGKFHRYSKVNADFDNVFREKYYYGGRCQCFESGIIRDDIKVYDVNSMYPFVMRDCLHPIGDVYETSDKIGSNTCFISAEGKSNGSFPHRENDGTLNFTKRIGEFHFTIHEWEAAISTDTFSVHRIIQTFDFHSRICFQEFVNHFYDARKKSRTDGDIIRTLFYKFVLNSSYGKFAIDPKNFFQWQITSSWDRPKTPGWDIAFVELDGKYIIWKKPLTDSEHNRIYKNITTGASITGAARAILWQGICAADRPLYCDTDSIICRNLPVETSDSALGAWKLEDRADIVAIAGKKLYALFTLKEPPSDTKAPWKSEPIRLPTGERAWCVKKAHKGGNLTGLEIFKIAQGATIENLNPVPRMGLDGGISFTKRRFRKTA